MKLRILLKSAKFTLLLSMFAYVIPPDLSPLRIRNVSQAIDTVLLYLKNQSAIKVPDKNTKWQEKTLYSKGPQDFAITSKLFTFDNWLIEVYQGVAPLSRTIYQITVFNDKLNYYWKGSIRADGGIADESAFRQLSVEESKKTIEEFMTKSRIPPPKPGGYGH